MKCLRLVAIVGTLLVGPHLSPALAQSAFGNRPGEIQRASSNDSLAGTWDLILTFGDGSRVKSVLSVLPGASEDEGSVIHAAEASLLLPNPTTPEQGVWAHLRRREFVASYYGFAVDSTFTVPAGRIGFKHRIVLAPNGETFTGRATFEVLDPSGAVVFSDALTTAGRRQHAVAP